MHKGDDNESERTTVSHFQMTQMRMPQIAGTPHAIKNKNDQTMHSLWWDV